MKRFFALLTVCVLLCCTLTGVFAFAAPIHISAGQTTLPLDAQGEGILLGWSASSDGATVFLAPGAAYNASANTEFSPVFLSLSMTDGAAVRTVSPAGLRFTASVGEQGYQALCATGTDFTLGTLIAPTDTVGDEFTAEALDRAGKQYLNIENKIWWEIGATERTYTAVIADILEQNYNRAFSAVPYIEVNYTDGTHRVFYGAYDPEKNSRSVYSVACAALVAGECTDEARALLTGYFDTVGIDIVSPPAVVGGHPEAARANTANPGYTVESVWMCQFENKMHDTFRKDYGYQITITVKACVDITENTKLVLNGEPLTKGYTVENGVLTIIRRYPLGDFTWAY